MEIVGLRDFSLGYGDLPVLKSVSLSIRKGEFVALMGAVGGGKTSLLLSLNGVLPKLLPAKTSGQVFLDGLDTKTHSVQELSRHAAYVFQNPADQLFALSVAEEIAFGPRNHGVAEPQIQTRVRDALKTVGLAGFEHRDPTTLSHGQKQKVAIASALASDAPLMVLDEPASQLDHAGATAVYNLLTKLNRQGKTILVADHDTDLLYPHAKRFLLLERGKIALEGGKEIFRNPSLARAGIKIPCELEYGGNQRKKGARA